MMARIRALLQKSRRAELGSMAVEMALFLFFFSTLFLGTFEVPRYLLIGQKMERAAASMADLVAQIDPAQDNNVLAKINDLFKAASGLMSPYDLDTKGRVIITSLSNPDGTAEKVAWQLMSPGSFTAYSKIGTTGGTPVLPTGMVIREGENIIVAEIVFKYEPLFGSMIYSERTIYTRAFTRPRFSNLTATPK
ncbi:TadE/TadG family type IV pilus assembly protein [Dongia rigui]|uniref:TadE/TadG family type IV pilus assembly protein n=1 Tax=Dongia rigui TaxID=940149 RepID=A0ABU5DTY1_9PROT|nr:TadE/TadG family type IV pilus assembly protein [Dongia rigui]MDY0870762.1 TadE/TadG family type IV pilus assembly protein [Dongia rigui]